MIDIAIHTPGVALAPVIYLYKSPVLPREGDTVVAADDTGTQRVVVITGSAYLIYLENKVEAVLSCVRVVSPDQT